MQIKKSMLEANSVSDKDQQELCYETAIIKNEA